MLRVKSLLSQQSDSRNKSVLLLALITAVSLLGDSMLYIALPIHWKEAGYPNKRFFVQKKTLTTSFDADCFLVMLCLEGMVTATLSHLIDVQEITLDFQGVILSAAILASLIQGTRLVIGVFVSPWIGKMSDGKWGRRPLLIATLFMATLFVFMTQIHLPNYPWLLNLVAVLLTSSILVVLFDSSVTDFAEESLRAVTITAYVMVSDIGAAFGPVLGYLSEDAFGLQTTYWISAAVLFFLSLQWIFVNHHGHH